MWSRASGSQTSLLSNASWSLWLCCLCCTLLQSPHFSAVPLPWLMRTLVFPVLLISPPSPMGLLPAGLLLWVSEGNLLCSQVFAPCTLFPS